MPSGGVIAAVAIDDFLVAAENHKEMNDFYDMMRTKYNIKRLGMPTRYLGWHFHYAANGSIALIQRLLVYKTLQEADMLNTHRKSTPYPAEIEYHAPNEDDQTTRPEILDQYRKLVGDVRYISDSTRPDIVFVVDRLVAASASPTQRHWKIMKATLRYVKRTRTYGLFFSRKTHRNGLEAACKRRPICARADADWENDKVGRLSVKVSSLTWMSIPIGWLAHKQDAVAMSATDAEYRAMADVVYNTIQCLYTESHIHTNYPKHLTNTNKTFNWKTRTYRRSQCSTPLVPPRDQNL